MGMPFPTLDWIFERRTNASTPLVLKVAIVVQGLFAITQTRPVGPMASGAQGLWFVALWAVEAAVLTALWKMKRWPLAALTVYALLHAATAMPHYFAATPRSLPVAVAFAAIVLAVHNIALVAALPFWRRMSWT